MRLFELLCIVITLLLIAPTANANPAVMVTDYKVNPTIFMPGDEGTLALTIQNTETQSTLTKSSEKTTTTGETIKTTETSSISAQIDNIRVVSSDLEVSDTYHDFGNIGPGASTSISFQIDAPMKEGTYFPEVWIDIENGADVRYPFLVRVDDSEADLIASDIPEEIPLDVSTDIELTVTNERPNPVKDVNVVPITDMDISPEKSFLGEMRSGQASSINFTIDPKSVGEKNITFRLEYKNGDNLHERIFSFAITVKDRPDVELNVVDLTDKVKRGDVAKIGLDVANAKSVAISGVTVIPEFEDILPSKYFVGKMEPDDIFSADFELDTSDLSVGTHTIPFKVGYKQDNKYYETTPIHVNVDVMEKSPSSPLPSHLIAIPIAAVCVALAIYIYKRKK